MTYLTFKRNNKIHSLLNSIKMKLVSKASLAFKKKSPALKVPFGLNVINSLTGIFTAKKNVKAVATDLPVPIAELQALNDALNLALTDSQTGTHASIAAVKVAVANWNIGFTTTAVFITSVSQGDAVFIRTAGFVSTKSESQPSQRPGPITNFKATINGTKGAIIAGAKTSVFAARGYVFSALPDGVTISYNDNTMVITAGDKVIFISVSTQKQTELYTLPSGVPYNVSGYAINSAGSGPATATQQVIPQ